MVIRKGKGIKGNTSPFTFGSIFNTDMLLIIVAELILKRRVCVRFQ